MLVAVFLIGLFCGAFIFWIYWYRSRRLQKRKVSELLVFLENTSLGNDKIAVPSSEDDLSELRDEISKTVIALHHAQKSAITAKEAYAENLANIAHQIKTPLTIMSLALQKQEQDSPVDFIKTVKSQTERLQQLQSDLLLMAKLDSGTLKITTKPEDLYTILCIAADNVAGLAEQRNIQIHIDENNSTDVDVDIHWICEAIINVLKNCIEHSPIDGEVTISYQVTPLYAEILITDEGDGLKETESNKIFDRFYTRKTDDPTALGLGLAFSREIIELQNGTIRAYKRPDVGTCFEIRLY